MLDFKLIALLWISVYSSTLKWLQTDPPTNNVRVRVRVRARKSEIKLLITIYVWL